MALFSSEKKQEKQAAKEQAILEKYGLTNVRDPKTAESLKKISSELLGTGMMEAGMKLSMIAKTEDHLKISFQRAIVEQNFIIIRQLDQLCGLLQNGKD